MRYTLLQPQHPTDPRELEFNSLIDMYTTLLARQDRIDLEQEAVSKVRALYPDAVAMPLPVHVGSGMVTIMGVLASAASSRDPEDAIPFVLFVHAIPETAGDKQLIKRNQHFHRALWKPPVVLPSAAAVHQVEIRGTDLDPVSVNAIVGRHTGSDGRERLAVRCDIGGVAMSLVFQNPDLVLVEGPPDADLSVVQITE